MATATTSFDTFAPNIKDAIFELSKIYSTTPGFLDSIEKQALSLILTKKAEKTKASFSQQVKRAVGSGLDMLKGFSGFLTQGLTTQPEPPKQDRSKSYFEKPVKVLIDGITDNGYRDLMQKLPDIIKRGILDSADDFWKTRNRYESKDKDKSNIPPGDGFSLLEALGLSRILGGLGIGSLLKGVLKFLTGVGGIFTAIYAVTTSDSWKGLAKMVAQGLLSTSGLTKIVQKFAVSIIDNIIELPKKLIGIFGKTIGSIFGRAAGFGAIRTGLNILKGFIPKALKTGLIFLRKIPIIGTLLSIGVAADRARKGDYFGGFLDILSGIAAIFPGIGTGIAFAIDGLNALLDYKAGGIGEGKPSKGALFLDMFKGIGKWFADNAIKWPVIGPAIKAFQAFEQKQYLKGFKQLAYILPMVEIFGAMVGDTETTGFAQTSGNILKTVGKWLSEQLYKIFKSTIIIGPAIKAVEEFMAGNYMKGFKQLAYIFTPFEVLGAMLGDTEASGMAKATGTAVKGIGQLLGAIGAWAGEAIYKTIKMIPVIGPAIKAVEEFMAGNYAKGFKQLAYIFPPFEFFGALMGDTEASGVTKVGATVVRSIAGIFNEIQNLILRSILNLLPESILGISIRSRVAKMLGINLGAVSDKIETGITKEKTNNVQKPLPVVKNTAASKSTETELQNLTQITKALPINNFISPETNPSTAIPLDKYMTPETMALSNTMLEKIVANTGFANDSITKLYQAIFKLAEVFNSKQDNVQNNLLMMGGEKQPNQYPSASQVAASNRDPIRQVRLQFMPPQITQGAAYS